MSKTIGWDIGGAHLKAVLLEADKVPQALQVSCELWRGLNRLEAAIGKILELFDVHANGAQHSVTMTGELVDLFSSRAEGVLAISKTAESLLGREMRFYASEAGFVDIEYLAEHALTIASANWHCSASLIAKHVTEAIFVDMGSTTTDIIPIVNGHININGYTDAQRMKNDTLVYTGVVRTPLMALAQKLPFQGRKCNVAAEYFATTADVYRLTGELQAVSDTADTADGKGKTMLESAQRLARMIGYDAYEKPLEDWVALARACRQIQTNQIKKAIAKHVRPAMSIIGAGAGAFLIEAIASELELPYLSVAQVLKMELNAMLPICFPAYAVACMAQMESVAK